jgi:hypothetical protein
MAMSATQSQERLPAEAVRSTRCELCGARPARPCTAKGDHVRRWLEAYTARVITRDQLHAVIVRLVIVTRWTVVPEHGCEWCGLPAPEGSDLCGECEETAGATAVAVLRELAAERGE